MLRKLIDETRVAPRVGQLVTVEEAGRRYIEHAERRGRKRSTLKNLDSELRIHLAPFFGTRSLDSIGHEHVADFVETLEGKGLAPKSIHNVMSTLAALFNFARSPARRWVAVNPCDGVELPAVPESEEIRLSLLGRGRRARPARRRWQLPGDRPGAVPHRRDDRATARRAARAQVA